MKKQLQKPQQRTTLQNRALHLYFTLIAGALNDAGLDMRKVLKPGVDIPWSGKTVKEHLWKPVLKAQLHKDSTTEMTTKEIDLIFDTINRYLGEKFGIHEDWPSIETIMFKQLGYASYTSKIKETN